MNYRINPDLLAAAQEMASGNLTVPPDARTGRGDTKRWTERLVFDGSTLEEGEDAGNVVVRLQFRVSPASENTVNMNRRTTSRNQMDFNAGPGSGRHTMTAISLSRLTAFLRACGEEVPSEGFDLSDYFGQSPAVVLNGREVNGLLADKPDRDDKTIRRQEITNFLSVED